MFELKDFHTEHGHKTVLVGPKGHKLMPVLIMESSGLTVRKVPLDEARFFSDLPLPPNARGIKTVARKFKAFGDKNGMTKAAKSFLKQIMAA